MSHPYTVETVSREELKAGLANGTIALVDVREPDEFADGHVPGATLNPLQAFEPDALPAPEAGRRIVMMCRSGRRTLAAIARAQAAGRTDVVTHYPGSMLDWIAAGEPIAD